MRNIILNIVIFDNKEMYKYNKIIMTKRVLSGVVVSDKNDKTVVVKVKRKYIHPFFKKVISSSKKYHAHDEKNEFKNGDNIKIVESKPYSKNKQWKVFSK